MKELLCMVFGHQYWVRMVLGPKTRCVGCHRCGRFWAMHDPDLGVPSGSLLPWDADFSDLYGYTP